MIPASLFEKFYRQNKDDQGLMVAVGVDPMSDEVPENLARAWFEERRREINRKLSSLLDGKDLKIYRCLEVDEDWLIQLMNGEISNVGTHWTIDPELAPFLKGGYGNASKEHHVIIEAVLCFDDVNLLDLFQASYAEDYEEYEVMPEGRVELLKLWDGHMKTVLFQFEPGTFSKS